MNPSEQQLFDKIASDAHVYRDEPITLSSGIKSNHYFDMKQIAGDPGGITLVANVLYDIIRKLGDVKSVGGLESGSISLATAVSQQSFLKDPDEALYSFFVRKKPKGYGMKRRIEGCVESPAVVIDDVITTGASALEAVGYLKDQDVQISHLLTLVYRGTAELKAEIKSRYGVELIYVFHEDCFEHCTKD